jgi:hypothetical protein
MSNNSLIGQAGDIPILWLGKVMVHHLKKKIGNGGEMVIQ